MADILKEFSNLPRFPDGRINYSESDRAPVITCFVMYKNKILLLKRSDKVRTYKGKWNTVAGYIDEKINLKEKALGEMHEELGINKENILHIKEGRHFELNDISIGKTWIVFPFIAELKNEPKISIDWEHTEFRWINPEDIKKYDVVFGLEETLKRVL